jgi:HEPN domain-containing protein
MNINEHMDYWLDSGEHDLETAESLFASEKYDWCLFLAHLVLEKVVKALYVRDNDNRLPPKTHNLVKLAEQTSLALTEDQKLFLDEVNDFNVEVRYPVYRQELYKVCTKEMAEGYLTRIKEFYRWVRSQVGREKS